MKQFAAPVIIVFGLAIPIQAVPVDVEMTGTVDYNLVNFGQFAVVKSGDPVSYTFQVDSDLFMDSGSFNVRGYEIVMDSFTATLGAVQVGLADPFPGGLTPYFVIRDNDPAVDGFYLTYGGVDFPAGLPLDEPGAFGDPFEAAFEVSYTGDTLGSLDILDAAGAYAYDGIQSFYFNIVDLGFEAIGINFTQMTIVPEPSVLLLLPSWAWALRKRRRR